MMRAAVLGYPVKHSLSPLIHGYWLKRMFLDGSYEKIETPPDALPATLDRLQAEGYRGVNLTIPHKEHAYRLLRDRPGDVLDRVAAELGAVNTLVFRPDGSRKGLNTDGFGFITWLRQRFDAPFLLPGEGLDRAAKAAQWERMRAGPTLLLGAGGAARGVVRALLDDGFRDIHVQNRTRERAEQLSSAFDGVLRVTAADAPVPDGTMLLVNATSTGMDGRPDLPIDLSPMAAEGVVYDLVYKPLATGLLRQAGERGLMPVDGLGMLIAQAIPAFEQFYGYCPRLTGDLSLYLRCKDALDPCCSPESA